jgi:predicted transcriptional regulator
MKSSIFVIRIFKNQKMDIQAEKLQLIEWLARLNNTTVLKRFISLKKEEEKDWWDQISAEEKREIEEGLMQADHGETTPHKEVMDQYTKWR